jgi:hypothetical protein
VTPAINPLSLNAKGIPMIPAPTMELTRLLQAPEISDFVFGKLRFEIWRLGGAWWAEGSTSIGAGVESPVIVHGKETEDK